jgi:hypothetical protein
MVELVTVELVTVELVTVELVTVEPVTTDLGAAGRRPPGRWWLRARCGPPVRPSSWWWIGGTQR